MTKEEKRIHIWKKHVTMTKKPYKINKFYLLNQSLSFIVKNYFFSATFVRSPSLMVYNNTASLDKLTCAEHVDFGKSQNGFG